MMKIRLALFVMILFLVPGMICSQATASGAGKQLPPTFEENRGQLPEDYRFLIRDVGYILGLTADPWRSSLPDRRRDKACTWDSPEEIGFRCCPVRAFFREKSTIWSDRTLLAGSPMCRPTRLHVIDRCTKGSIWWSEGGAVP